MSCELCPFGNNGESEHLQNIGCLPMPSDVFDMKETTGDNWACHNDSGTICKGFVAFVNDVKKKSTDDPRYDRIKNMDTESGGLITLEQWSNTGIDN